MTFICFIESEGSSVPHMEPMTADNLATALVEARRMLGTHSRPLAAHVFKDDQRVETIIPDRSSASAQQSDATKTPSDGRRPF